MVVTGTPLLALNSGGTASYSPGSGTSILTFTYTVAGTKIVSPRDVSVLRHRSGDWLVLTACHPLYSAAKRIVVSARLTRTRSRAT